MCRLAFRVEESEGLEKKNPKVMFDMCTDIWDKWYFLQKFVAIIKINEAVINKIIVLLFQLHSHLSVNFDHGFAMTRIYFVSAVRTKADPVNIEGTLITVTSLTRCATFSL